MTRISMMKLEDVKFYVLSCLCCCFCSVCQPEADLHCYVSTSIDANGTVCVCVCVLVVFHLRIFFAASTVRSVCVCDFQDVSNSWADPDNACLEYSCASETPVNKSASCKCTEVLLIDMPSHRCQSDLIGNDA